MNKLEKFLIYVPIIGIFLLIKIFNSDNIKYEDVVFEDVNFSIFIQTMSVIFSCAMIVLIFDKIILI